MIRHKNSATSQQVQPGDYLVGSVTELPCENCMEVKLSSGPSNYRRQCIGIATLIAVLYSVTSSTTQQLPADFMDFVHRLNISMQNDSFPAILSLMTVVSIILLLLGLNWLWYSRQTHQRPGTGIQLTAQMHTIAETESGKYQVSDSDSEEKDHNIKDSQEDEEEGDANDDKNYLIADFSSLDDRQTFERRVKKCERPVLKTFLFCFMPPDKVEVILSHDCGLDVETVDVEQLKKELNVKPSVELRLLALAEECPLVLTAPVTIAPGVDIFGKCVCSAANWFSSIIALFLVNPISGVKYVLSTGHKRSAGEHLHVPRSKNSFATVLLASFLKGGDLPTVDVTLAEVHNNPGVSVCNKLVIDGRSIALSKHIEPSENSRGKIVQKFSEEKKGKKGKVHSLISDTNGMLKDCLGILSVDDESPIHEAGESGTLLVVQTIQTEGATEVYREARGFAILNALFGPMKFTDGTSRCFSVATPLDRTMDHIRSIPEFQGLEILGGNGETAVNGNGPTTRGGERSQVYRVDRNDQLLADLSNHLQLHERERQVTEDIQRALLTFSEDVELNLNMLHAEVKDNDRRLVERMQRQSDDTMRALSLHEQLLTEVAKRPTGTPELVARWLAIGRDEGYFSGSQSSLLSEVQRPQRSTLQTTMATLGQVNVDELQLGTGNALSSSQCLKTKIFNDVIHGNIELHPLLEAIIDTPQFQRLRNIKQLPGTYLVFPGAAHNHFEHSIGVAYLAGKLLKRLRKHDKPSIDDRDILCVQIAGLCIDLGIGPLSHVYEKHFIGNDWKHENMSWTIFTYMVATNNLQQKFTNYGLDDQDMTFIKEQITGVQLSDLTCRYRGRGGNKQFLYQVVGDRPTGLDVVSWDRYLRDSYHLSIKTAFDHQRLIKFLRVCTVPSTGKRIICIRDKEIDTLYNEFITRLMHDRNAIQHKVAVNIETMMAAAMKLADDHIVIKGSNCQKFRLSTAFQDVIAFSKLDDSIYHRIRYSRRPELARARQILENIEARQLYVLVDERKPEIGADTRPILADVITKRLVVDLNEDIAVAHVSSFYCGNARGQNPAEDLYYFTEQCTANAIPYSRHGDYLMRPSICREYIIRIYCKRRDGVTVKRVRECSDRIQQQLGMSRSTQSR